VSRHTRDTNGNQVIGYGNRNNGVMKSSSAPSYLWKNNTGIGISFDSIGRSVAMIGDINRDGIGDIAIGDPYRSQVYILFGSRQNGYMNMSSGVMIYGQQVTDNTGFAVSTAGDFNGDGITDMIVGIPYYGKNFNGASLIVYGRRTIGTIYINSNITSTEVMLIIGSTQTTTHGMAVTNIGDFNNDGYDDIAVSALVRSAGVIYIIYGASISSLTARFYIDNMSFHQGFKITSISGSYTGVALSEAGDINAD
jgi:hypothetical protein